MSATTPLPHMLSRQVQGNVYLHMVLIFTSYSVQFSKSNCTCCTVNFRARFGRGEKVQLMKREDQQDATIRCLLITSVSTCFGHHYAHLQENKGPVTAFGVLFWFCWMWLVAVVGHCLEGSEHLCSLPSRQRPTTATNHIQQNQNNTPNAVTGPLFS